MDAATSVSFPALTTITGNLDLASLPLVTSLDLSALTSITGDVEIRRLGSMDVCDLKDILSDVIPKNNAQARRKPVWPCVRLLV